MGRHAKSIQQQLDLLRKRGMFISDPQRAETMLLEVGWYRLSLYWFPFEKRWPDRMADKHEFIDGIDFSDAMMLYVFDFKIRHLLLTPLERFETSFRTFLIHKVSTRYSHSAEWMADPKVVDPYQARNFERSIYNVLRKTNAEIQLHHQRFPRDRFAPAWKTVEYLTFGALCNLYDSLLNDGIKHEIALHFGIHDVASFSKCLEVLRSLRNLCAHGGVLYSARFPQCNFQRANPKKQNVFNKGRKNPWDGLAEAIEVLMRLCNPISQKLVLDCRKEVANILSEVSRQKGCAYILENIAGINPEFFR